MLQVISIICAGLLIGMILLLTAAAVLSQINDHQCKKAERERMKKEGRVYDNYGRKL